jgi:hypothetical protein
MDFIPKTVYKDIEPDAQRIFTTFAAHINNDPEESVILVSVDKDNKPVGVIAGEVKHSPFSLLRVSQEYVFLGEDHFKLLAAFMEWSKWVKADRVFIATVGVEEDDRLNSIYKHKGWQPMETSFMKELKYV